MEELKSYLQNSWGMTIGQLVRVVLIVFTAGVLYADNNAKLTAVQSQNAALTQELKETNRELSKLSVALAEVRIELQLNRGNR